MTTEIVSKVVLEWEEQLKGLEEQRGKLQVQISPLRMEMGELDMKIQSLKTSIGIAKGELQEPQPVRTKTEDKGGCFS